MNENACATTQSSVDMRAGYPAFIDLAGRNVVVVGGGPVAQRKIETLLPFGANITLISPDVTEALAALADEGRITWVMRVYQPGDLADALIAFSACGDSAVDELMYQEAVERNILLNVVDVPAKCVFTVPSTLVRGPLRIAVSTSGSSPLEARNIRRDLESRFDSSWEPYLLLMKSVRDLVKDRVSGTDAQRRPIYEAAARAGWRERIAAGEMISVENAYQEALAGAGVEA